MKEIYNKCININGLDFAQRLRAIAEIFLDVEYGPWKYGSSIKEHDDFNYILNRLDCVTYVEVVLALVNINVNQDYLDFVQDFEQNLRKIHYRDAVPTFLNSNHFFCVDWIPNNRAIISDVTSEIYNSSKEAVANINKPEWFRRHAINNNKELAAETLEQIPAVISKIPYICKEEVLAEQQKLIQVIPDICIVNIVRPNWDLTATIGTHLNLSHLGLAFKESNADISFFHASSIYKKVVQDTLYNYVLSQKNSPTVRGINILKFTSEFVNAW